MDSSAVDLVREFFRRMNTNDFRFAAEMLGDDYVLEWPQSKERIRGRDRFVAVNEEYPALGRWVFVVNRIVGNETEAVSDVSVTDGVQVARAIAFTFAQEGKIIRQVEYWPENYEAPANRRHLVEVMEADGIRQGQAGSILAPRIEDNALVLLQGDSITDCGRSYPDGDDLGAGYAMLVAAWFSASYPDKRVRFLNRGISGNRVRDLRARWERDCLDLQPDWVSILIGANDTWRRYDSNDPTSVEAFERDYRAILASVRDRLGARLILCEPFLLPVPGDRSRWREDLDPKIAAVRRLAREFEAVYVPLDGSFAAAATRREPAFWLPDGVHPTPAGHALIAQAWLRAVGAR